MRPLVIFFPNGPPLRLRWAHYFRMRDHGSSLFSVVKNLHILIPSSLSSNFSPRRLQGKENILPHLRRILRQYFPVMQSEASLEQCFTSPPLLSFRRPRNLRDILVYGTQKNTSAQDAPFGTHKCLHSRCLTGPIVHNITQIQTNSGLKHIRDRFTCDTSSLVYVITCSKSNSVYVGETGQKLRERMNGHRADIKNKNNTPVGLHFNAKGHEPRISGLQKTAQDTTARRIREKKWIKLLKSCRADKCMNRDSGIDFLIL